MASSDERTVIWRCPMHGVVSIRETAVFEGRRVCDLEDADRAPAACLCDVKRIEAIVAAPVRVPEDDGEPRYDTEPLTEAEYREAGEYLIAAVEQVRKEQVAKPVTGGLLPSCQCPAHRPLGVPEDGAEGAPAGGTRSLGEWREFAEWDWVEVDINGPRDDDQLHAVTSVANDADDDWYGVGTVACNAEPTTLHIPGMGARMSATRCPACCSVVGFPVGSGSPKNTPALRSLVEARLASLVGEVRVPVEARDHDVMPSIAGPDAVRAKHDANEDRARLWRGDGFSPPAPVSEEPEAETPFDPVDGLGVVRMPGHPKYEPPRECCGGRVESRGGVVTEIVPCEDCPAPVSVSERSDDGE